MAPRALLTGATGFVGKHLVERLAGEQWTLRALVRATSDTEFLESVGAELVFGDLLDPASLGKAADGVDVVFHLAAVTAARSELEYREANANGTRAVIEGIRQAERPPRQLVYLSSYAAIGPSLDGQPRATFSEPGPLTAYGRTKLEGEEIARGGEADGLQVTIVRAPAVFGPGDRALLPYFRLIRMGLAPMPDGGATLLHLVFAPDLALALTNAAATESGTFAVADPMVHRWSAVVDVIAIALGRNPIRIPLSSRLVRLAAAATESMGRMTGRAVAFNREKAEEMLAPAWICDLAGSESLLPREAVTPLSEAIEQTVRWYHRQGWL